MHQLTHIFRVVIAVLFTAVVTVLFSTLTGCRSCNAEEEVVRWVPAPQDTIPIIAEDSLDIEPVAEDTVIVAAAKPIKRKQQPISKPEPEFLSGEDIDESYASSDIETYLWYDEFDLDSIQLTIIIPDLEVQITQSLADR